MDASSSEKCMSCFKDDAKLQCRHCKDFFICSRACAEKNGVPQDIHANGECELVGVDWARRHSESPRGRSTRLLRESDDARRKAREFYNIDARKFAYWREVANKKAAEARQIELHHGLRAEISDGIGRRSYQSEITHWQNMLNNARTKAQADHAAKRLKYFTDKAANYQSRMAMEIGDEVMVHPDQPANRANLMTATGGLKHIGSTRQREWYEGSGGIVIGENWVYEDAEWKASSDQDFWTGDWTVYWYRKPYNYGDQPEYSEVYPNPDPEGFAAWHASH